MTEERMTEIEPGECRRTAKTTTACSLGEGASGEKIDRDLPPFYEALRVARRTGGDALFGDVPADWDAFVEMARRKDHDPTPVAVDRVRDSVMRFRANGAHVIESRLSEPGLRFVVTGQQPAVVGGPLMVLAKAMSAVALAERLTASGVPTVPLFWVADEDHDATELFSGLFPGRADRGAIQPGIPATRRMLAELEYEDPAATCADAVSRLQGVGKPEVERWLRESCSQSISESFARFIVSATGGRIVPVFPGDLRDLQAPVIADEIEHPGRLAEEVEAVVAMMRERGLRAPIAAAEALPLFSIDEHGRRFRIRTDGDDFVRVDGGRRWTACELSGLARSRPESFSPDALLRPIVQNALFRPVGQVLGPTELGYNLEVGPSHRSRGVPRPVNFHRVRPVVSTRAVVRERENAGIGFVDFTPHVKPWSKAVSPEARPLVEKLEKAGRALTDVVDDLAELDESAIGRRAARMSTRLRRDIERLEEGIERHLGRGVEEVRQAIDRAHADQFVDGAPAERRVASIHTVDRFGAQVVGAIGQAFDPFDEREVLVAIENPQGDSE